MLVTPGRVDQLADAMELLIGNAAVSQVYGDAGRRKVRNEYSVGAATGRLQ